MKFEEFKKEVQNAYAGKFPKSRCVIKPYVCFGSYIAIDCFLAENLREVPHQIAENDMFEISFLIDMPEKFNFKLDELPEEMTMKNLKRAYVIAPKNSYLYCDYRKIPYRKTSGDAKKMIAIIEKFFDKLDKLVREDKANGKIHNTYKTILPEKLSQ